MTTRGGQRGDWTGADGSPTAQRYERMAEHGCGELSPSYARLCHGVAGDPEVVALLDTLPAAKRQPNLLLGAVRLLDGPIDAYPAFREFVVRRWEQLAPEMLARRTQTNEARRLATLLPVLAGLPQPLALLEVGASAGLCLHPDRYAYRYDRRAVLGDSSLVLQCATGGAVPVPDRLPQVTWRAGLDLNPLDVHDEDDMRWLECLIWPEETERFAILRAAIAIARQHDPVVVAGDLTTDLPALAAGAPRDATLVVFHSAVLAYLDAAQIDMFRAELARLGRPVVWLANEGPGIVTDYRPARSLDDFVITRDGEPVAIAQSHGAAVTWL